MSAMQTIYLYTDGGSRGNPGPAGAGAVVYEGDREVASASKFLGIQTNNVAEYEALLLALTIAHQKIKNSESRRVVVRMDSELIVKQMNGEYRVKNPALKKKYDDVRAMILRYFPNLTFEHVRREYNARADELANHAMDHPE